MIGEKIFKDRGFGKILIKYLIVYCFEKMSLKNILWNFKKILV